MRLFTTVAVLALLSAPAYSKVKNDDLHFPGSVAMVNAFNLHLYKTKPHLTYWQRYKRSFGKCMAVGVVVEIAGVWDPKDLRRDAAGCLLQFNWEWKF